jgi:hypothetical protein
MTERPTRAMWFAPVRTTVAHRLNASDFHSDYEKGKTIMSITTILLIILVLILIGALPTWGYSSSWGYAPSGVLGAIVIIMLVLLLLGRI